MTSLFDEYARLLAYSLCGLLQEKQLMPIAGLGKYVIAKKFNKFEDVYFGKCSNPNALTMIGIPRLMQLKDALVTIHNEKIAGDVIECGVWRGGASIFMRKILDALEDNRTVFLADSFRGLPNPTDPNDLDSYLHNVSYLSVSEQEVYKNCERYKARDGTCFISGWFTDSLPDLQERFAILRIDADMYTSTKECFVLYKYLSKGGYIIIDDYGVLESCKKAVDEFRAENSITIPLIRIDRSGVYWRKG
jgi:O-methyltransferase